MRVTVKLEYKDKVYISNGIDVNEEEKERLAGIVMKASEGKASHLTITKDNQTFHFGKKVLRESIITITNVN